MAKYKRLEVYKKILDKPIVPVFYNENIETVKSVITACYTGGVRVFEFTNRGDFAHEVFQELSKWCRDSLADMALGVGSILDAPTAALYIQCGADFVVSPYFTEEVARLCNSRQVGYIPGCGSVKEIGVAQEFGAEIVKVFPAGNVGGPSFIKNVLGPLPWSRLMVTGGVEATRESIETWFRSGVTCIGLGSKLFPKEVIVNKEWQRITENCKRAFSYLPSELVANSL